MGAEDVYHRYDDSPGGEVTGELHSFQTVFYGLNLNIKLFLALPSGLFFGG